MAPEQPTAPHYAEPVRGILVVNPRATTTSPRVTDVLVQALQHEVDLDVVTTEHRGHAQALGRRARNERRDVVITLGGDGTINEVVNGMLAQGPGPDVPRLATVPGGSANVIARALGLPADPVEATGVLLEALRENRGRTIGLGTVTLAGQVVPRWFVANAGLGIDAEIIVEMERQRAEGHTATPTRYFMTTMKQFFAGTNRREPALTITRPGTPPLTGVFLAILQNTSPWTYLGAKALDPCPRASFETGIDVFAVRRMGVLASLRAGRRMVMRSGAGSTRSSITVWHDQAHLRIRAGRPVHLQVDGEALGEISIVDVASVPNALTAVV